MVFATKNSSKPKKKLFTLSKKDGLENYTDKAESHNALISSSGFVGSFYFFFSHTDLHKDNTPEIVENRLGLTFLFSVSAMG